MPLAARRTFFWTTVAARRAAAAAAAAWGGVPSPGEEGLVVWDVRADAAGAVVRVTIGWMPVVVVLLGL
jgi:hypothetical protein